MEMANWQNKQRKHYYQLCCHPITILKAKKFKIKYDFLNSFHHPRLKSKNYKEELQLLICWFAFSVLDFEIDFSLNKILDKFCYIPFFNCLLCLYVKQEQHCATQNQAAYMCKKKTEINFSQVTSL